MIKKGQSTLEYAVVIAVVVIALLAMQIYIRRGFSGRLKEAADSVGQQYWPGSTESDIRITETMDSVSLIKRVEGGGEEYPEYEGYYITTQEETITNDTTQKTGSETIYAE